MNSLMIGSSWLEKIFWFFAIFSSLFFIIRMIMLFVGGDVEHNIDAGHDIVDIGDTTSGEGALHHDMDSSDSAFDIISINSLTAFFMMFGWVGLTCYKQYSLHSLLSIVLALIAGIIAMFITAYLFKAATKLVSHGDTFDITDTIGKRATVYQKIFADGRGKIHITINGILREIDAFSENKKDINSFEAVEVIKAADNNCVIVKKI